MIQQTAFSGEDKKYSRYELSKMSIDSLVTICKIKGIPDEKISYRPPTPPKGARKSGRYRPKRKPSYRYKARLIKLILKHQSK